jgi:hypothetical protein
VVACVGYRTAAFALPAEPGPPLVVALERGTRLELVVRAPDGIRPGDLRVRVASPEPPFESGRSWVQSPLERSVGLGRFLDGDESASGGGWAWFGLDASGRLVLSGLRPHVPLGVSAESNFGTVLYEAEAFSLEEGEHRLVEIEIASGARTLAGRVVDAGGGPLANAEVRVSVSHGGRRTQRTGEDGGFRFEGLGSEAAALSARKLGFVELRIAGIVPPEPGVEAAPLELRMVPGRSLWVRVIDPAGEPVEASRVECLSGGEPEPARLTDDGAWRIDALPDAAVRVRAHVGGKAYERRSEASEVALAIEVPAHGSAEIRAAPSGAEDGDRIYHYQVELTCEDGRDLRTSQRFAPDGAQELRLRFPALLPGPWKASLSRRQAGGGGNRRWRRVGEPVSFEVEAGRRVEVVLGR